jgi:hypothetical protein
MVKPKPEQDEKGRFIAGNSGNGGAPGGTIGRCEFDNEGQLALIEINTLAISRQANKRFGSGTV